MTATLHETDTMARARNAVSALQSQIAAEDELGSAIAELVLEHGYTGHQIRDLTEELTGALQRGSRPHLPATRPSEPDPWVPRQKRISGRDRGSQP